MNSNSKLVALGAFACVASCLAALALPALLGGGLAALAVLGWEAGLCILLITAVGLGWFYLRRRRRAPACGCATKADNAEAAP